LNARTALGSFTPRRLLAIVAVAAGFAAVATPARADDGTTQVGDYTVNTNPSGGGSTDTYGTGGTTDTYGTGTYGTGSSTDTYGTGSSTDTYGTGSSTDTYGTGSSTDTYGTGSNGG
jgi:hypothetical protein